MIIRRCASTASETNVDFPVGRVHVIGDVDGCGEDGGPIQFNRERPGGVVNGDGVDASKTVLAGLINGPDHAIGRGQTGGVGSADLLGLVLATGVHLDAVVDERSDRNRDAVRYPARAELVAFRASTDCAQTPRVAVKDKSQPVGPRAVMDVVGEGGAEASKEIQACVKPYGTRFVQTNGGEPDHIAAVVHDRSGPVQSDSGCVVEVGIRNDGRATEVRGKRNDDQARHDFKEPDSCPSSP